MWSILGGQGQSPQKHFINPANCQLFAHGPFITDKQFPNFINRSFCSSTTQTQRRLRPEPELKPEEEPSKMVAECQKPLPIPVERPKKKIEAAPVMGQPQTTTTTTSQSRKKKKRQRKNRNRRRNKARKQTSAETPLPPPPKIVAPALCPRLRHISIAESEDSFIVFIGNDNGGDNDDEDEPDGSSDLGEFDSSESIVPTKKVRFAEDSALCHIHPMVKWSFAYQAARKGPWEEYARDRDRFRQRCFNIERIIHYIFSPELRQRIYHERFELIN